MNLAFYGTLRDPDILALVLGGDTLPEPFVCLAVAGWACLRVEGEAYPLLRSNPSATALFHLYHDCREVSWRRLVAYEGPDYHWIKMAIAGRDYRVFMAEAHAIASDEVWQLETFLARDKTQYLASL